MGFSVPLRAAFFYFSYDAVYVDGGNTYLFFTALYKHLVFEGLHHSPTRTVCLLDADMQIFSFYRDIKGDNA